MDRSLKSSASTEVLDTAAAIDKGILVAVRIRPLSLKELESGAQACCEILDKSKIVTISQAGVVGSYLKSQAGTVNDYAFDAVFDSTATQMDVYQSTAKPFIPKVIAGLNVTVFAYGATSAGKTHTMFGSSRADSAASHAEAGIIPNAVSDVFKSIEEKTDSLDVGEKWEVNMSYIEVYNEQIYDLLVPVPNGKILSLREDQERGIVMVAGVLESKVETLDEVMKLLALGNRNRKTEATMANQVSSRSHAILQLNVIHTFRLKGGKDSIVESKLSLIDLAGSERASATNNRGVRLMEGANINKSLLALANCINALAENSCSGKKGNVKFRDSKLTLLLKNSLEGRSNLVIIANINPSHVTLEDSHNTLKYANRAKNIKVNPLLKEVPKDLTWAEREVRLMEENKALRKRVAVLENIIDDLRAGRSEGGSVQTDRDGATVPLWDLAAMRPSLQPMDDYTGADEATTRNRMSDSFSSTISSYSDMMEYPFASEYEASQAAAASDCMNISLLQDCDEFEMTTEGTAEIPSVTRSDSPTRSSNPQMLLKAGMERPSDKTEEEKPVRSTPMKSCRPVMPSSVTESARKKRPRFEAFEDEQQEESSRDVRAVKVEENSSKNNPLPILDFKNNGIEIVDVCSAPPDVCGPVGDESVLKKRRMSAIPTMVRASLRKRDSLSKSVDASVCVAAEEIRISAMKVTKAAVDSLSVFTSSVIITAESLGASPLPKHRPRRAQSVGSRRRTIEIQAVNALLASLPEHLQAVPKGSVRAQLEESPGVRVSLGVAGKIESIEECVEAVGEIAKPLQRRMSTRVQQKAAKSLTTRLAPIAEDENIAIPYIENPFSKLLNGGEQKSSTRRSSSLKKVSLYAVKDIPFPPSSIAADVCIDNNAWMTI